MKNYLLAAIAALMCMSCTKTMLEDDGKDELPHKKVQFVVAGITEAYSTRATIQSVGMTDLWVLEGTKLLDHQVSTDADFGLPTVDLTYGSHDLTFVASKADGQTFTTAWSCTKVKDTFAKAMNVTVSGGSSNSRQVQLARRSSQVCFNAEDVVPATVKYVHIKAANHLSLDASLVGGSATDFECTLDISDKVGKTYSPAVNLLTESATDEEDCDVMIEFLNSSNAVLYHFERTIKLKPNRCTTLKGKYFSGSSNEVSVDETWLSELVVPLFSE